MIPHERYIRYLIMCGRTQPQVNNILNDLALSPITEKAQWTTLYRSVFEINTTKEIKAYWRSDTAAVPKSYVKFMKDMGMTEAHTNSKTFRKAISLAEDSQVCKAIQMLLMKRVDLSEIAAIVGAKFKVDIDTDTLECFTQYLFNSPSMTKQDWREYYTNATDNVKAFLIDVFRLDIETLKVQYGLPARLSYTSSLQELHVQAMSRVRELLRDRHPESDRNARAWANLAIAAGDRYEKFSPKDMANFGKEVQLGFDYVETKFPSISELTNSSPTPKLSAPVPIMEDPNYDDGPT